MDARPTGTGSAGRGHLHFAWLELTHACNLRCAQCYTHSTPQTPHRSLPTTRWMQLLDEIAAAGGEAVQLTGGEATRHPQWREILQHACARGLHVELFTNGTSLAPDDLDLLAQHGVSLAISLHAHRPEVHDRITGVTGSFEATLRTIRAVCDRGLHLRVATVLMEENAGDGPRVEALMRRQGVLTPVSIDAVRPTGRGRQVASPGDAATCTACRLGTHAAMHQPADNLPQATCWDGKIAIDPEGNVTPCIFSRETRLGNVATTPLPKVLAAGPFAKLWALTVDDVEACRDCDRKAACFDCRALPLAMLGDLRAKNPRCDYQPPAPRSVPSDHEPLQATRSILSLPCGRGRVLLDRGSRRVHALNESAARLFDAIEAVPRVQDALAMLGAEIVTETDAPRAQVMVDLEQTRRAMLDEGLLVASSSPEALPIATPDALWPQASTGAHLTTPAANSAPLRTEASGPAGSEGPGLLAVPRMGDAQGDVRLVSLRVLEGRVYLEASEAAWKILAPVFAPLATAEAKSAEQFDAPPILGWLQVQSRRSHPEMPLRHYLLVDGRPEADTFSASALCSLVEGALCGLAGEASGELLHAAAIAGPAGVILLPGPSGVGKSVLCVHAVAAGATYLSDELACWTPEERRVTGLFKPVTLKGEGSALIPPGLGAGLTPIDPLDEDHLRWLPLPGDASFEGPLVAVVIPDRHREGSKTLQPISSAEGAAALLQSRLDLDHADPASLRSMVEVCAPIPAFVLATRDLPAAARALVALLHEPSPQALER